MLPKFYLTSHSRMPGFMWVITLSWLSRSLRSFSYSSSMYSCHLFLISLLLLGLYSFCSLLCPFLHEIFLWYFQFLEEISSLSPSVVFLYFFALFIEECLLVSPWYSVEFCIPYAREIMEQLKISYIADRNANGKNNVGYDLEISYKVKHKFALWPSNHFCVYLPLTNKFIAKHKPVYECFYLLCKIFIILKTSQMSLNR